MRDLLKHRCTIQRNTPVNDNGVVKPSWANVATNVPCLIQAEGGGLRTNAAGQQYVKPGEAFFLPGADLRPNVASPQNADRILMTAPARLAGVYFRIEDVTDEAGQGHHLLARITKLPG